MNIVYGNNVKKQLSDSSCIKKSFGKNAQVVSRRIAQIEASNNLAIFMQLPGANCHQLTGDRNGQWAVNISGNHRLIFIINHDPIPKNEDGSLIMNMITEIKIIETTDYH